MRKSTIIISYMNNDYDTAQKIQLKLENLGLLVTLSSSDIIEELSYSVNPEDYVILLISNFELGNKRNEDYLQEMIEEFYYRGVNLIPVILSGQKKSPILNNFIGFNLSHDFEKNLDKLARYLKNVNNFDFENINGYEFELLIRDLLKRMSFKIEDTDSECIDDRVDIIASSINRNQLVGNFKTKWIIECKFYRAERLDVNAIKKFTYLISNQYPNYKGILITNGVITSAAKEALKMLNKKEKVNVYIVDGGRLKQLLLKYPGLISTYFSPEKED
ncbi:restriction endonuclease [Bacillus cereus group sp. TH204-1LC]|uniref:restriction endonuclease n=1 Tax=unclassified Bacillus cereus group TaxID=2750818 RepID=UPI0022E249CD|nr:MULTISPECIES: restriction endonuclease [unclassified Bacillus cereus group]MDA1617289.1 restriction endonuclease [Bacillus cereus group sp. TH204-1LC]MDX5882014.1 restriction endonuclease [Bacillus cereus group sp. BfR-BA-00999]